MLTFALATIGCHLAVLLSSLLATRSGFGSWIGDGVGPVYGTGVALTLLLLPYAYVPIYQR